MSIVTGKVRLSYVNLLEPRPPQGGGEAKYGATILLPKSDTATMQAIQAAIEEAAQYGVSKKWEGKRPANLNVPMYDGDAGRPSDGEAYGDECKGHWVLSAKSKTQPGIVDQRVQPILDSTQIYSGMYALVEISFYAYNTGAKKGIGIGLNNVQKVADGEMLGGGRRAASEVFKPVECVAGATGGAYQPPANPYAQPGPAQTYAQPQQPVINPYQAQPNPYQAQPNPYTQPGGLM